MKELRGREELSNVLEDWADCVASYVYDKYSGSIRWQMSESRWHYVAERLNPSKHKDYPQALRPPLVEYETIRVSRQGDILEY